MNDEEIDELILGRLRQLRGQDEAGETSGRTVRAADLAAFFNELDALAEDHERRGVPANVSRRFCSAPPARRPHLLR